MNQEQAEIDNLKAKLAVCVEFKRGLREGMEQND